MIIIDAKIEKDNLFAACFFSFLAIDSDIAGTNAVENAKFTAIGKLVKLSTLDSIPVFSIAICSNASFPPVTNPLKCLLYAVANRCCVL